jgi:NAD(P)-dependent dehydrogenase (short-subunit alcohol dehydrogenase family)
MSDLAGKTILVTGATNGIGLESSVQMARRGAMLVLVGRDPGRTERAVADVKTRSGNAEVSSLLCDMASLAQVRRLAAEFLALHDRLDVLVNNAGTVYAERTVTEDGFEATFAVNHLAPFLLTNLLLDRVRQSAPARVVNVASTSHHRGKLDFDDLGFERGGYFVLRAYERSKLANVLFTRELARRLEGTGVTVNSLHPGTIETNIWTHAPRWTQPILSIYKLFMVSLETGAGRITQVAADPIGGQVSGRYFSRNKVATPSKRAQDDEAARRLWDVSAALVKL